jgi:hypothetical protein
VKYFLTKYEIKQWQSSDTPALLLSCLTGAMGFLETYWLIPPGIE